MQILHSAGSRRVAAYLAAIIVSTTLFPARARVLAAEAEVGLAHAARPTWLVGAGKDLRIKLAGEIVDKAGLPANDCRLTVTRKTEFASTELPVEIQRNRFQAWVPVGDGGWFNLHLNASASRDQLVEWQVIAADQLRQAAIDGITLALKTPERFLEVTVVENGSPVHGAFVRAEVIDASFSARTNDRRRAKDHRASAAGRRRPRQFERGGP